jgi:hypothetical protein
MTRLAAVRQVYRAVETMARDILRLEVEKDAVNLVIRHSSFVITPLPIRICFNPHSTTAR